MGDRILRTGEGSYVADASFSIWIGSELIEGWRGEQKLWEPEILENVESGEIVMKLDGENKYKL